MDTRAPTTQTHETAHLLDLACSGAAVVAGLWLLIAPFGIAMDFTGDDAATWATIIAGAGAVAGGGAALSRWGGGLAAFALAGIAGAWAVLSPYVLSFDGGSDSDPAINAIVTGIVLVVLAVGGAIARTTETD